MQKAVVNGAETDVLRVPADLMLDAAKAMDNDFNFVFSDKPSVKTSENMPVADETVTTDETTSSATETTTDSEIVAVANAMNETFLPGAKEALEKTDVKGDVFKLAELIIKYYKQSGNIDVFSGYFSDKGAKVIAAIEGKADTYIEQTQETPSETVSNDVLKNQSESDTMEEKVIETTQKDSESETNKHSVESEEDSNGREDLLHGYAQGNDESSREQTGRVQNPYEEVGRRSTTAERLRNEGRTERINIDENNYCDIIHKDDYTDDMNELSAFLKKYGLNAKFFVGSGINSAENIEFSGCIANGKDIYIQYDHEVYTPEMIAKHELIHALYNSEIIKKIRNILKNSYSKAVLNHILSDGRYAGYMELYKDTGKVFEEFVCDTLSGMNGHSFVFENLIDAFWNNNYDFIDNYKVNEYAEETDAGGEVRYSLFPGGVFPKGSQASEEAIYWAHNKAIETGAQRIFFYKGTPYRVEKFDSMDLGYLVIGKLSANEIKILDEYDEFKKGEADNGKDYEQESRADRTLSDSSQHKQENKHSQGSGIYNHNSDKHNGETAGVQRVDREQDGERSAQDHGSEDNKRSIKDSKNEVKFSLTDSEGKTLSKEQGTAYMKAVENGDMETAQKFVDEAAESKFPNSKVRGTDGKLLTVYHGTVNDFTVFDRHFSNIEGDFGKGYYFTSNEYDVAANYANEEGPDLKNKIARYAEQLEWNNEYSDLSYEEREEIARQKFITSEPNTITAYLNMENPVYITPDEKGTFLDFNEEYDEEYDEYGEPEGLFVDFIEALKNNSYDYAYDDINFDFLWEHVYDEGGMYASDAVKIIKNNIVDELSDDSGDLAINEVIRLAFEEIGFDGIIDTSVYYKFNNMNGMDSGTTHYIVFDSNQIKSAEPVTYDNDGNVIPLSERFNSDENDFRWSLAKNNANDSLGTQKKIESIAEDIGSHDELIEYAKKNTKEFVDKIKQNESLQKRLHNAKRQMLVSPKPAVNVTQVGKITKEILTEMDSTLKAIELKDEVINIYNEYFDEIKKAKGVESKIQAANDNMMDQFAKLAVDIVDSAEALAESENYESLKSYIKNTRIRVPDSAKADAHYAEFRKSHMGTFNLTNDGLDIDVAYMELCGMFPGMFDTEITHPADQLNEIANVLENLKPYAYNPHSGYMQDAIDHVVFRFASEVDGLATMPKTKAQKMAEKSAYDKEAALEREKAIFEQKLDKHKAESENTIRKLQKKIDDAKYVNYWEKRLSKEEKAQAIQNVRDKRDVAILKSKIRNIVSDMKKKLDKTEKTGGYPKELVQATADVCSVLDFHTDRTGKDGAPTKASLKLDALKMQYDALKNNPNFDFQTEYSEELSNKILNLNNTVSGKRVIDLSIDELTKLKDILSEINHSLSIASKQIGRENALANMEIAKEIINSLKLDNKAISEIRNQLLKEMKLAKEKGKGFVINPHRIFEMISNYDKNSEWWKLYDQILRGSRDAAKFTMDATLPFDELTDGGGNEIAFFDFRTKTHKTGIKYQDGTEVELPKSIICELVILWDRKQGRRHLESSGIKIPDLELFNKGKTADALASGKITAAITQSDITRVKGMLDSYDKAWIERSRHLFNKVAKDAINETSMQLVGRELAKADNYIRIYVDSDFIRKDIGKEEGEITIEGHGSLKETTPDAKNPVVLRGLHENVYEHIDFASKYYGLAIPIRNFNKVYKISINVNGNFDSVKNALGSVYGPKIRDGVVVQSIKDLQSPRVREISLFNKVRGKWLGATFFANIRSTLKQTTSYWTATSILDEGSLAKGLADYTAHRKQTKAEIAKYSGTLYKRSQGLSTAELGDRANRKRLAGASSKVTKFINEYAPVLRKVPEWIRPENWLQSMDCAVSSALWDACKHQVSKTMNKSDDGYMEAVRDLYERVIEETQSNYDVLHRPEILKSTNAAYQTLGMFQTDNLQQTGIMYGAFGDLQAKHKAYKANKNSINEQNLKDAKKRMGKAIRSRIYSSLWLATVTMLGNMLLRKFKSYIDDEEKEITSRSVLEQMMLSMAEDMLGVFVPIGGQLVTKAMDTFSEGYDFISDPAFDVLEDFIKATSKIHDAYAKDGDVLKAWIDAIPEISNMTGVPAKNIMDLYNGIKGYVGDIKAGEFAHDLTDYTSGNKSFYDYGDLASYIVSGDTEKETKWLNYYSENDKEIANGSLTKEIKPAYVQMYVDSPEQAENIKRKLILDYDYSEASIKDWGIAEYLKNIVSNPEYAAEIKSAMQKKSDWKSESVYKDVKKLYKDVYKSGDKKETEKLKDALLNADGTYKNSFSGWEKEADSEIKKAEEAKNKEKAKYK